MRVNSQVPSVTVQRPQVARSDSSAPSGAGTGLLPGVQVGGDVAGSVQSRFSDSFDARGGLPAPFGPGGIFGQNSGKTERDDGKGSGGDSDGAGSGGGEHNPPDIYDIPFGGGGGLLGLPGVSGNGLPLPVSPGPGTGGLVGV